MISAGPAGASNHPVHLRTGDCGRVSELSGIWAIWPIEKHLLWITTVKGWMSTLVMKSDHRKLHNILIRRSIEKYWNPKSVVYSREFVLWAMRVFQMLSSKQPNTLRACSIRRRIFRLLPQETWVNTPAWYWNFSTTSSSITQTVR